MPRALPLVLSDWDLPHAELLAARLDGEVFGLASGFCAIDEIVSPAHRAFVTTLGLPGRLIPEQLSAAWVWGALPAPPHHRQFCVRLDARVGHPTSTAIQVREVVIDESELTVLGGVAVTNPLRTAVDLARFSSRWTTAEQSVVSSLMAIGQFDTRDLDEYLSRRNKLPAKRLARDRVLGLRRD